MQVYFGALYSTPQIHISVFVCLFVFCQYCAVLITVALRDSLQSRRLMPLALYFFPHDCFGNSGSFVVPYIIFRVICSSSMKNTMKYL